MQILGRKNDIIRPEIKANGESIVSMYAESTVGEVANCSFTVPPELFDNFKEYGKQVEIKVKSETANGTIFKGVISGTGFSNMAGSLSCRVDLVHEMAYELDNSSTLFPGHTPGNMMDNMAYVKTYRAGHSNLTKGGGTILPLDLDGDDFFADKGVGKFVFEYIDSARDFDSLMMEKPQDYDRIKSVIPKIGSFLGQITGSQALESPLAVELNSVFKSSSSSTSFWNSLSSFLAQVDATFTCDMNGELFVIPNFSGIGADNFFETGHIVQFDQSSRFERTPKEVVVTVWDDFQGESTNLKADFRKCGQYVDKGSKSAHGTLSISAPTWMMPLSQAKDYDVKEYDSFMDKYAEMMHSRNKAKMSMCNMFGPLTMGLLPGTPMRFKPMSNIKAFGGERISAFDVECDGYCYRVRHEVSTDGYPRTSLNFSHVTLDGSDKIKKHPIWPSAKTPDWT